MRLILRALRILGLTLYAARLHWIAIWLGRRSPTMLVYHACEPDDTAFLAGRHLSITPEAFARQLDFLCAHYRIVDLATLESGVTVDRALAVTFDDGLRSIRTRLLPALQQRAVPARVYLVTKVLNNAGMIWIHELVWVLRAHPTLARVRAAATLGLPADAPVETFAARARDVSTMAQVEGLLTDLRAAIGYAPDAVAAEAQLYLTDQDLKVLMGAGVTFGNHTVSHQDLTRLDAETCAREIREAAARLASVPGAVPSLAYPFGRRNEEVRALALSLGMRSLAEVGGRNAPFDPTRIARVSVAHQSVGELFAQMAVVEPVKAWLLRVKRR
jgi:peptidoglycan/xylan/chitin deacetylase (PgdA/CDA1 family)